MQMKLTTRVDRGELLAKLEENLKRHRQIVKEANDGYLKVAAAQLETRLSMIRNGKLVRLNFELTLPSDHSRDYLAAIDMLKWSQDEFVTLQADDFRRLVHDEWEWRGLFLNRVSQYSATARDQLRGSGENEDEGDA